MPTKSERHEAIRERARRALGDLYHNATITYPREDYGRSSKYFDAWLGDAARFEVEYMRDGGAYGGDYQKTLAADCNAGRYKSERARAYYVAKGMRERKLERADCGMLTGWRVMELTAGNAALARKLKKAQRKNGAPMTRNDAQWERIGEFGKLYTYGCGGRTLAPADLIRTGGGGSFGIREDYADDLPIAAVVDLIRVLESFNGYVARWCAGVPEMWREHCAAEDAEELAEKKRRARAKARETRERNYWAARGVITA